ncbi:MAG: Flagellar hook-length control protein FliK [Myxococcales bacterium]|nr:Flagellar hook-length control protein FliK [Myxococcales bacterium]
MRCIAVCVALLGCGRFGFEPTGTSGDAPAARTNIAFVTSTTHVPGTFTSVADADAICMARASEANLSGTFVAFLSTGTTAARDRLAGSRGWSRTDGKPFADRLEDLFAGRIYYPLRLDEHGLDIGTTGQYVATGSRGDGTDGADCNGFAGSGTTMIVGNATGTTGFWADVNTVSCAMSARLYCFEVGRTQPLVFQPTTGRRAFVTEQLFTVGGGLAAADALCTSEVQLASLTGSFHALLPTMTASAASRFALTGPTWVRLDGIPLADTPLAFMSATVRAPLNLSSIGSYDLGLVYTGGNLLAPASGTCADWTTTTSNTTLGRRSLTDGGFLNTTGSPCNAPYSIFCLED